MKRKLLCLTVILVLMVLLAGSAAAQQDSQPRPLTPDLLDEVSAYVESLMGEYRTPGAAVAIVQNGEIIYTQGFGVSDLAAQEAVNPDTLFMIGSTTKSMTAVLAATLVDEEAWNWDDRVTDLFPDFALQQEGTAEQLRVRDLFNMSTGVPRYDWLFQIQNLAPDQLLRELALVPQVAQPGQEFHYSNMVFALGGYLAAVQTGAQLADADAAYADLLQTRLFDPVGMTSSTMNLEAGFAAPNGATPYTFDLSTLELRPVAIENERFVVPIGPAGAVWSNAHDMARYMQMLLNEGRAADGAQIVSPQRLEELWAPQIAMNASQRPGSYALGFMDLTYDGQRMIAHDGNTGGFTSSFSLLPDDDLGVLVLSNRASNNNFGNAVTSYVFELAFDQAHESGPIYAAAEQQLLGIPGQITALFAPEPLDPAAAMRYTGSYDRGIQIDFDEPSGTLSISTEVLQTRLIALQLPGVFYLDVPFMGVLVRFSDGNDGVMQASIFSPLLEQLGEVSPPLTVERLSAPDTASISPQESTDMTTQPGRTLISAESIGSYTLPMVQMALANSPFASSITPEYGVDLYRLIYTTTDYRGEQVTASGLLAVPETAALRGAVSYQRGTNPLRTDVPSTPSIQEGLLGAAIFAGRGYLYLAADYIGGGVSTEMHPYYHADSTANAVVDLLRAAHHWTADQGIAWPRPLLLTGFSQGGHATMAAHRALQTLDDPRFQVSASAPIAGPVNVSAISIPFSINGQAGMNSLYIAYIANSYSVIYDQPLDSFLREPYASEVPALFDGTHTSAEISAALPTVVEELVQPEMLAQLRSGEDNWFVEAARQNDVYDWAPAAPVRLYYGERDLDVGSEHALFTAAYMATLGADVQAISAGETDHAQTILAVFADVVAWFDSFAPVPAQSN